MPLTLYNKYKGMCEPLLTSTRTPTSSRDLSGPRPSAAIRPRQRLDLSVNILTNHAVNNGKITVFGGSQKRPEPAHPGLLRRCTSCCCRPRTRQIAGEIFNVGYQNLSIMEIAATGEARRGEEFPGQGDIEIVTTPTDDIRSYHINSDKIARVLGFRPKHTIEDAVRDCAARSATASCRTAWTTTATTTSARLKRLQGGMTAARPRRGRHRRRRLHRQPHGGSAARARLRGARDRQSGRRARSQSGAPRDDPNAVVRAAATSASCEPDTPLFADARYVFHFAGIGDIVPSIERPLEYMAINVQGTVRAGMRARCRRREVRLRGVVVLLRAGADADAPRTIRSSRSIPTRFSKYQGEQAVFHWHRCTGCRSTAIRIFNAYGPRVRTTGAYGAVFGVFLRQKLAGKPFTVVGDGTQRAISST